jgi:peroxiredoxin
MKPLLIATALLASGLGISMPPQAKPSESPKAPELEGSTWLNVEKGKEPSIKSRAGKVTLVAFWTFACINCQNNFKPYSRLLKTYRRRDVELLSIHTPELEFEKKLDQVEKHVKKFEIDYPVLVDSEGKNWKNWKQGVWPTLYVIDGKGRVRFQWTGELNYKGAGGEDKVAKVIDYLLAEKS